MSYTIWKEFKFEASHRLPHLPPEHKCSRLHGHSYSFKLFVSGKRLDPALGWLTDFGGLVKAAGDLIVKQLDHQHLNDIQGLDNPTVEILAKWIADRVSITQLGESTNEYAPRLVAVEALETAGSGVRYDL